jgi:hypothetical protein
MRLYVIEHDKKEGAQKEFDLNNPPRNNYVHQPFPKLLYGLHADGHQVYQKVADAEEHEAALDAGWANEPVAAAAESNELPLEPGDAAEAVEIDARIAASKKKARPARR